MGKTRRKIDKNATIQKIFDKANMTNLIFIDVKKLNKEMQESNWENSLKKRAKVAGVSVEYED